MALAYVHGVGNRWQEASFQRTSARRNDLFRRFLLPLLGSNDPLGEPIATPLWGDDGARLRWNGASLPGALADDLGAGPGARNAELIAEVSSTEASADPDTLLCAIAHRSVADAVDLLYTLSDDDPSVSGEAAESLVAYTLAAATLAPHGDEVAQHPWLAEVRNDLQFVDALWQAAQGWSLDASGQPARVRETTNEGVLGIADGGREILRRSQRQLRRVLIGLPTTHAVSLARRGVGRRAALLLGDVTKYLAQRDESLERKDGILHMVASSIEQASALDTPVVVVAHSMGGNIVYDLLTTYRPDLVVDVFVTVGSQVGLFEELELFRSSDARISGPRRIARSSNIRHWINVVDPADPLAFRAGPIFDGVSDYRYPTNAAWAHSGYLVQPHFHARIAARIAQALS